MTKKKDEIAKLKKEIADLKASLAPKPEYKGPSPEEWADQMHQLREARASQIPPWMQRECSGGVTPADCADIIRASHAPRGPSAQGAVPSSQQISNIRGGGPANIPGSGTGWAHEIPLGPPPGVAQADRLMDAQDRRDRIELAQKIAAQNAALGKK
jgi:hypothetical protein